MPRDPWDRNPSDPMHDDRCWADKGRDSFWTPVDAGSHRPACNLRAVSPVGLCADHLAAYRKDAA